MFLIENRKNIIKWVVIHKLNVAIVAVVVVFAMYFLHAGLFGWKSFSSDKYSFSFQYPKDLKLSAKEEGSGLVILSSDSSNSLATLFSVSGAYWGLDIHPAGDSEIETYVDGIKDRKKVEIGNLPGYEIEGNSYDTTKSYAIIHRGNLFTFYLGNPRAIYSNDEKGKEIFEKIIGSVSFN